MKISMYALSHDVFKKSLTQAMEEREEIQKLLTEVRERLENTPKPE